MSWSNRRQIAVLVFFLAGAPLAHAADVGVGGTLKLHPAGGNGVNPNGIAYGDSRIFVANCNSDSVSVANDTGTLVWGAALAPERCPYALAVDETNAKVFVANWGDPNLEPAVPPSVSVVDSASLNVLDTIALSHVGTNVAVNQTTDLVYVANEGTASEPGNTVTIIDASSHDVETIAVGTYPTGVAVAEDVNKIFVPLWWDASSRVAVIDGATQAVSYFTGEFYQVDVAVTPDAERVYVLVNFPSGNDYVYVYEKDEAAWDWTYKSRILVSNSPHALHYDPTNERLYVATRHYWAVDVYFVAGDANLWTGSIFYDDLDLAQGVVSAPAWNKFFVSLADGTLATYAPPDDEDPPEDPVLTHLEPLGVYPWAVAANSSTGKVYAACQSTGDTSDVYVARIPGYKKRIPVLGDAETVSVNAATNKVYVSHGGDVDQISVIDGATDQVSGTTIDLWSRELAVNSTTNRIYVLQGSRYQVIDGSNDTILCSVETVSNLQHIAVDEVLDKVYVNSTFPGKEMHVFEGGCSPPAPVALAISEFGDIAVDSAHHLVYVADLSAPFHVVVVNGTTNLEVTKVPVDIYPRSLAVDPVTRTVFVASHESEEVRLIDAVTNTPLGYSLTVDSEVWGLGVDAAAGRTYTANKNAGTLSLLDAVTIFFDSFEDGSFSGWTAIGIGASPAVP